MENKFKSLHESYMENALSGRYIHNDSISKFLQKVSSFKSKIVSGFKVEVIGKSVEKRDIHMLTLGKGSVKILMWSQMHGNESTTTKAVVDFVNAMLDTTGLSLKILTKCQIKIIPILNPDGALAYTRVNANKVDLNRDAQALSQPESRVLRSVFDDFQPNYCFNLHGQRTIFGAGQTGRSAVVSFLSPAEDKSQAVTETRKIAMELIVQMNEMLQNEIPDQVGIYDDSFNSDCAGDTFQSLQVPTVLFEAGHINNDYSRQIVRKHIFDALITAVNYISEHVIEGKNFRPYLEIPNNRKCFFDVIIRNAKTGDIAIQYEERLSNGVLDFVPMVAKIGDLKEFYGHREIDAQGAQVFAADNIGVKIDSEIDFVILNNEKFALKLKNS